MHPTIHIVTKDPPTAQVLSSTLRTTGLNTQTHTSPSQLVNIGPLRSPTCVLVDLFIPSMGPKQIVDTLRRGGVIHPLIFMATACDAATIMFLLEARAFALLKKPLNHLEMVNTLHQALRRDQSVTPAIRQAITTTVKLGRLGGKEREVVERISDGYSAREIAETMGIARRTVENYRANAFRKLGISSSVEVTRMLTVLETIRSLDLAELPPHPPPGAAPSPDFSPQTPSLL